MRSWRSWSSLGVAVALAACAPHRAATAQDPVQGLDLPPAGYGTLRQDQVGIRISTADLAIRVLPLDERVIRLLSPDAYRSLSELRNSRADDIARAARAGGQDSASLFIVTFFALQPATRFSPDELYITAQGSFLRPIGIVPLTSRWSENIVDQRQQAVAIYLFEATIPILRPFGVAYRTSSSNTWEASLRVLDAERARAISRAQQQAPNPNE